MKLIDADKLSNKFHDHEFAMLCPLDEVDGVIDYCLTVSAVEVVKCRDCKHSEECEDVGWYLCHCHGNLTMRDDDFCSYGERKE